MFKKLLLTLVTSSLLSIPAYSQGLLNYKRFYSQAEFAVNKTENLVYAQAKTNYFKYNGSGSVTEKNSYTLVKQIPLTLDLYDPNTSSKPGQRAVLILIPGGGRTGCLGITQCDNKTIKQSGLYSSQAYYIAQEGTNYNEIAHTKASDYAKSGFLVLTLNTRYTYHDKRHETNGTNRWYKNGNQILNNSSAHLENLIVDIKRAIRWISNPQQASRYNIDPDNIFIQAGSGGAKMASLAAVTANDTFLADSPSDTLPGSQAYMFEVENNNLLVPQKALRGAILFAGDMQGTAHRRLITADTGALMLWHGTKDRSILHGIAETIEEKCEHVGCTTQFYSLANVQHGAQGAAKFEHTDRQTNSAGLKTGVRAHLHDFIINHLDNGHDSRPSLSINSSKVKFNESAGHANIEITLSRQHDHDISVTVSADQMREVMLENASQGNYSHIESYVANDSLTTGPIAYDQGTGVAFEDVNNVTGKYRNQTYHSSGPGIGNPVVIPSISGYFIDDLIGKKQVITIPAGERTAQFRVQLIDDTLYEQNECFKVRLLNANGARISNSVEMITILDDDNPNAGNTIPRVCNNPVLQTNNTTDTQAPSITITAPTKTANGPINDTIIIVEDNESVFANDVVLNPEGSATTSNFSCHQLNTIRVECSLQVAGSGDIIISAVDEKGNVALAEESNYQINISEPDTKKPLIWITAPTKTSASVITDTIIRIEDNRAVSADNVELRSDNSAGVSNFNCVQINTKRVDCIIQIHSTGDLKLRVTDNAGNVINKNENGYSVTSENRFWINIKAPTKSSVNVINDTTIRVHSDQGINASAVALRADNTALTSGFSCKQTSNIRVDCIISIIESGALKIKATDLAGQTTNKIEYGYVIN